MLAGSIANNKLTNSAVTIAGNNISLGGSIDATTLRESLGLSNAMHFVGIATVAITDGSTTNPSISGYTTKQKGDVIIDKESAYEYVWTGSKWEKLGGDDSYKTVQTAVADPTASGNSSTFIKTISQDKNGVITATKATIANHIIQVNGTAAATYNGGTAVTLNLKKGNGINITNSNGAITFAHSNSVTAKTAYGSTATTASANGGSITVTDVKYDAQGHITGSTDRKITLSQTTYTLAGLGGVPTSRTVNGKALTSNISLTAGDVGAATANHTHAYLPLAGGTMTGDIDFGNAANSGIQWTTNNGTRIRIRPYSPTNVFQITMKPSDGDEFGAVNIDTSGNISLAQALTIANGGTGATTVDAACANIGALRYKQYDNGYFETGAANNSAWLQFYVSNEKKCQMDLFSDGKVGIGGKTVLVAGDVIPYAKYNTNNFAMDSWIDNNAYTLMLRDGTTDKCSLVMWPGGVLTVNGSIVATEGRDNTFSGTLTVSNNKSAGGYVKIWEDNEGGNIELGSKSGYNYQMDAYNDNLRLYSQKSGSVVGLADCDGSTGAWSVPYLTITQTDGFYFSGITEATTNADRPVWFGGQNKTGAPTYNNNLKYNPFEHKLKLDGYESQSLWMRNATSNTSEVSITFFQGSTQRWTLGAGCGAAGNDFTLWDHINTTLALDIRSNKHLYVYNNLVYDQRSIVYSSTAPSGAYAGMIWLKPV